MATGSCRGSRQLLPRLIEDGVLLGLVTGNIEAAAHIKLARGHLNRFFSFGGYGSDSADRTEVTKAALARGALVSGGTLADGACIAVGDTPRDVKAGHGAGIEVVGVATGSYGVPSSSRRPAPTGRWRPSSEAFRPSFRAAAQPRSGQRCH